MHINTFNWSRIKESDLEAVRLMNPNQVENFRKKAKIKIPDLFISKDESSLPLKKVALTRLDSSTAKYNIEKLSLLERFNTKKALKNIVIGKLKEFVAWEMIFQKTINIGLFEEIFPVNSWWFKVIKEDYQKDIEQLSEESTSEITYEDLDNFIFDIHINSWYNNRYEINIIATPNKKWKEEFILLQMGQSECGEKEAEQDNIFLCIELAELQDEEKKVINECLYKDSTRCSQSCQLDKYRDEVVNTITNNYLTTEKLSVFSEGIIDETYRGTFIKSKQKNIMGDILLAIAYEHDNKIITTVTEI